MKHARIVITQAVQSIVPIDTTEALHQEEVLAWTSGVAPLFRISKPDNPSKHLVSYFVLYDEDANSIMLIDHVKAGLWLPPGGHVDPNENPHDTVIREAQEELKISADFTTRFGNNPLFVTVTVTRGSGTHTDVSLWYVIKGDVSESLWFDKREMNSYKWMTLTEILAADSALFDPHLHRFVSKMQQVIS